MSQVVITSPGRAELRSAPPPLPPGSGEVVVAVDRVNLCGSDYGLFRGVYGGPRRYPIRCGHEWSGTVEDVGRDCHLQPGDRVTGDCSRWCGSCDLCRIDRNLCRRIEKFGITCDGFAIAHRTVAEKYLYRDRFKLGGDRLALCELFAVALRGIHRADASLSEADEVLVVGGGPLGLAVYLALKRGVSPVDDGDGGRSLLDLTERDPHRLERIRRTFPGVRAAAPVPELDPEPLDYHHLLAEGRYGVVFDCSGTAEGLEAALRSARPRATVVCYGLGAGTLLHSRRVVLKGLTLVGSIGGTETFHRAMELLAVLPEATHMVTHRFPSNRAQEAFETAAEQPDRLKAQLLIGGEIP